MKRHMRGTSISAEEYLRKEMSKANRSQTEDNINKLIDCFALLNQHEHSNNLEIDGKDIIPETTQPPQHTKTYHHEEIKQSGNRQKNKLEFNMQKHTQETFNMKRLG